MMKIRDFPGGPVAKNLHFHCRGAQVQSLVRELRSHIPHVLPKKKKNTSLDHSLSLLDSEESSLNIHFYFPPFIPFHISPS